MQDRRNEALIQRSEALWRLGYPKAALREADRALKDAREISHSTTLIYALAGTSWIVFNCGNYAEASAALDELALLADEKGASYWKAMTMMAQGAVLALTRAVPGIKMLTTGISNYRATGATVLISLFLAYLGSAYAQLGDFDAAWRYIHEALAFIETTKEAMDEAEVNRIAG